jgi:DNA-directed RNA polymerase specialized sigma24 family protein
MRKIASMNLWFGSFKHQVVKQHRSPPFCGSVCGPRSMRSFDGRLKYFLNDPGELASSISATFAARVKRMDLGRVQRVAATLIRSTERDVMRRRVHTWAEVEYLIDSRSDDDDYDDELESLINKAPLKESTFGIIAGLSMDEEFTVLRDRLLSALGTNSDIDLLLAVLVIGIDQIDASRALNISHDAARKRFQRAIERLRKELQSPRLPKR